MFPARDLHPQSPFKDEEGLHLAVLMHWCAGPRMAGQSRNRPLVTGGSAIGQNDAFHSEHRQWLGFRSADQKGVMIRVIRHTV